MTERGPVVVRLRTGPVHLAFAIDDAHLLAVCGGHFGSASAVSTSAWTDGRLRVCEECEARADRATSVRQLRALAGV